MARALASPARASVEQIAVGEAVCLFRPDNFATALVNAPAAEICSRLLTRPAQDATDNPLVADLERQLAAAGFLEPQQRTGSAARTARGSAQPFTCYSLPERPVIGLAVTDPRLGALLSEVLQPLRISCPAEPQSWIELTGSNDGFELIRDGYKIASALDLATARRAAIQALMMALLPQSAIAAILHASSVSRGGRAIVLAGATGSGKSTLSLGLVGAGCGYVADDFTALDASGTAVTRFPIAASVKSGSLAAIGAAFPQLSTLRAFATGDRVVRYLDLAARAHGADSTPIKALVFPKYAESNANSIERMTPEEAFFALLDTGSEVVGLHRSMRPIAYLVNTVPAWSLTFHDMDWAIETLLTGEDGA